MSRNLLLFVFVVLTFHGAASAQSVGSQSSSSSSTSSGATDPLKGWYGGLGVSFPLVSTSKNDYRTASSTPSFQSSSVTVPHLFAGYRFDPLSLQFGYRKLGVVNFETAGGATKGNTHSNAAYVSGLITVGKIGESVTFYGKASANLVRTITEFKQRAAGFPIKGSQNVLQLQPSVGLGVEFRTGKKWATRIDAEWLPGRLGDAVQTGRTRQTVIGIDLVRHF